MREIKFRVWDKHSNRMWREDNLDWLGISYNGMVGEWTGGWVAAEQSDYVLLQYTGLKDKNGVEIYEGDILRLSYDEVDDPFATTHSVEYCADHDYPAFDLFPKLGSDENGLSHAMACMWGEVIGNIYENPEMVTP